MEKTAVRIQGRESVAMTTAEFGRLFATWRARFEAIACRYVRSVEFELEKAVKQLRVALKDYLPVLLMLLSDNILRS